MDRQKRTPSTSELLANVRRARQLTERYGYSEAHPDGYLDKLSPQEKADWDALLGQIK